MLIATDGTELTEGSIRTDAWGMGLPEGQNVRYISGTTSAKFEGRTYAISYKGIEILSADGSTILSRESIGQAIEVKNGIGGAGIGIGQIQDGVLIGKMETEATVDRFSFYEKNDYVNNIHNQIFNQWNSQEGNLLGLSEAFPNEGFGFDIKFSEGSRGFVRDGVKILSDNSNEQLLPEPKSQYYAGGGPIGSGLLSMEDAKLMKEFLGSEEFKVYLSDVREGFVTGFVDMGKDAIELAKVAIKYGCHPSGVTIFQIALAVHKLRVANAGKELEVIGQGVWNVAKGVWTEIVESTTTGKGHGRILAEATGGVVVGRAVKVFKIAGKVVDEVMHTVPDGKVCPREFGLIDKELDDITKFKIGDHSPLAPGGGLGFHEALKGHTLFKHVNKPIDYLKGRFIENPGLKYASTFYDRSVAEKVISETLDKNKVNIKQWLKNTGEVFYEIDETWTEAVGIRISKDLQEEHIKSFRIVLKIDPKSTLGYKILTAYPFIP